MQSVGSYDKAKLDADRILDQRLKENVALRQYGGMQSTFGAMMGAAGKQPAPMLQHTHTSSVRQQSPTNAALGVPNPNPNPNPASKTVPIQIQQQLPGRPPMLPWASPQHHNPQQHNRPLSPRSHMMMSPRHASPLQGTGMIADHRHASPLQGSGMKPDQRNFGQHPVPFGTTRLGNNSPPRYAPPHMMPPSAPQMGTAPYPGSRQRQRNPSDDMMAAEVVLNLYDYSADLLVQGLNDMAHLTGTGAFHAAVEVYGLEWSYCSGGKGDGIYACKPRENEGHCYRESIPLGVTFMKIAQVEELLSRMGHDWQGDAYDLLWKNCCHFSDELSRRLGVGQIPNWVSPTLSSH